MRTIKEDDIEYLAHYAETNDMPWLNTTAIEIDLFKTMLGERIGEGMSRTVYPCRANPKLVIKVERLGFHQNVIEWYTWREVKDQKRIAKWFAPVYEISPSGRILIMRRAEKALRTQYPVMVPKFLNDRKYSNFGSINGKLVCIDYGSGPVTDPLAKGLKKAEWWAEE